MRRGQVTLWILVGLAVLLLLLILLFRTRSEIEFENELAAEELGPVEELVASCTESSLERLLRRAGANGGYLDTSHLRHHAQAWESETVSFPPQDVPYWSHLTPCAESILGCEASAQPPLCKPGASCPLGSYGEESLQAQLEEALPGEVLDCLGTANLLSDQYEIEVLGEPSAEILYGASKVFAKLEMEVAVRELATGKEARIDEFHGEADVDVARIYRLANEVANAERQGSFLEHLTLHLIALYSGVDAELPPMRAVTLLGQKRYWSRTRVERLLQEEILPWSGFIQLTNAAADFRPIWPGESAGNLSEEERLLYAGIFSYLYVNVDEEVLPEIGARFYYPGSRPYLSINGGQEILKPRSADVGGFLQKIVGVFINDYRFRYTLAYPVIVTLSDESAFGGEGYDWSFALEANIWRNRPVNRSATTSSFRLATDQVDLHAPHQRVDNTISFQTVDRAALERYGTAEPVPYVGITYECGDEYFIGYTDEKGEMETQLPYCRFGGLVRFSKKGYLGSGVPFDNYEEGVERALQLELWPLENVTLRVRKRTPEHIGALTTTRPTQESIRSESAPLNESDMVILTIERRNETPYDEEVPVVGFFTFTREEQDLTPHIEARRAELEGLLERGILTQEEVDEWVAAMEERRNLTLPRQTAVTLQLAPGEYTVEAFLLHNDLIEIPEETREFCVFSLGGWCPSKQEYTLNATNFTTWLSGAATLDAAEPWDLNQNILYQYDNYTLYVLEQALPRTWHDLEAYRPPEEFLEGKRLLMLPQFD